MNSKETRVDKTINNIKTKLNIRFDKDLVKFLNINQHDIGNWRKRNNIPSRYMKTINRILISDLVSNDGFSQVLNYQSKNKAMEDGGMESTAYTHLNELNEFKNEKIKTLEQEIENLKKDNRVLEQAIKPLNVIYDSILGDFQSIVLIKNILSPNKLERNIIEISNYRVLAKKLGTTEETLAKYLSVGKSYKMDEHPVDKIIVPSSLKELKNVTKTIPILHNQFKFTWGAIYYKFTIIYNIDEAFAITTCYIKINWGKEVTVETKNVIHDTESN